MYPVKKFSHFVMMFFSFATFALGVSCTTQQKKLEEDGGVPTAVSADEETTGNSDAATAFGLRTVHFPFDSFLLDEEGKEVLRANAEILKSHPQLKIQIEGHCDQRGGIQYNIALGEKRAHATESYLIDLGVASTQMTVLSFGKERLLDESMTEEAHAKNRRANFAITAH